MRCCAAAALTAYASAGYCQQTAERLTQGGDVVALPSAARIVLAFLLVAGLAVAAAWALKRHLPRFTGALGVSGAVRVLERTSVSPGMRAHLLQVDDAKVLVVESRAGLALTVLPRAGERTLTS